MDEVVLTNFYNQEPIKEIVAGPPVLRFSITDVPNILFTSDMHLQHANIIKFTNRPYDCVENMNIDLVNKWNATVDEIGRDKAIIIHCGDFVFGTKRAYNFYINRLLGSKIYMIIGNHDIKNVVSQYNINMVGDSRIVWNNEYLVEIYDENKKKLTLFTVTHHPYRGFNGAFNLHGHLHTTPDLNDYGGSDKQLAQELRDMGDYYDVGVDANGYKPVRLTDILLGNTISPKMKNIDYEFWNKKLTNIL